MCVCVCVCVRARMNSTRCNIAQNLTQHVAPRLRFPRQPLRAECACATIARYNRARWGGGGGGGLCERVRGQETIASHRDLRASTLQRHAFVQVTQIHTLHTPRFAYGLKAALSRAHRLCRRLHFSLFVLLRPGSQGYEGKKIVSPAEKRTLHCAVSGRPSSHAQGHQS